MTSREILDALHNLQTQEIQRKATCECDVVLTFHARPRSRAPILRIIQRPVSESSSHTARNDWVSTCGYQLIIAQRVTESACLTKLMFHSNLLIIIESRACVGACNAKKWCACSIFFQTKESGVEAMFVAARRYGSTCTRWIVLFRSKIGWF